jgi:hypothetical protein
LGERGRLIINSKVLRAPADGAVKPCHGSQLGLEPLGGEVEEDMQLE